jgi:probable HAF family extracellular repeat protein
MQFVVQRKVLAGVSLFLLFVGSARAGYVFTTVLPSGANVSDANSINNLGQIVGDYRTNTTAPSFLLAGGTYTPLNFPGAVSTVATGINDGGIIVGTAEFSSLHGFLLQGGNYSFLDIPGARSTQPQGVNASSLVVGSYEDQNFVEHGFLYDGTNFTPINYPGATLTMAFGINSAGNIVGTYNDANFVGHGFLFDGTNYTSFDVPGATLTQANGINDSGVIVGTYNDASGFQHGFVFQNGSFSTVDRPGFLATDVIGINNAGDLVGEADSIGFLATPSNSVLPEPSSLAAVAVGAAVLLVGVRRRQSRVRGGAGLLPARSAVRVKALDALR